MSYKILKRLLYILLILPAVLSSSCTGGDEPDIPTGNDSPKQAILLYAVASNNLYFNLKADKAEILKAAKKMDLSDVSFYLYQVTPAGNPELYELRSVNPDSVDFNKIKDYSRDLYSTDPSRITEVIGDVKDRANAESYGLILWSHGKGWTPSFSTHPASSAKKEGVAYSFGSDNDPNKDSSYYDEIDIDELADALPDSGFNYIWFDACYMSGIETIYQLRKKCNYFVGYATEVYAPGMPYDLTIPYLLKPKPDLQGAAEAFFNDYRSSAATVAVVDMSKIEGVADYCARAYSEAETPDYWILQDYARKPLGPFYDFGQYTRLMAQTSHENAPEQEFESAMSEFVIYKAATERDFSGHQIMPENFSGISCHLFDKNDDSAQTTYYKTLDWYKRVYQK